MKKKFCKKKSCLRSDILRPPVLIRIVCFLDSIGVSVYYLVFACVVTPLGFCRWWWVSCLTQHHCLLRTRRLRTITRNPPYASQRNIQSKKTTGQKSSKLCMTLPQFLDEYHTMTGWRSLRPLKETFPSYIKR